MDKDMKKTIYILHGWAIDSENEKKWHEFRKLLSELGYETNFLAIPGLTNKLDKVWSLNDYVVWLENQLPKEKVILLGHSFGGQIVSMFASRYLYRVKMIILIDSSGMIDKSLKKVIKRYVFRTAAKIGKTIFKHQVFRKFLYKLAREKDYFQADPIQRQTMANVINSEVTSQLDKIEAPTLIIWGENDTVTPLKFAKVFNSKIKNSELHIIEGARHAPQFTHILETAKIIGDFLK